MKFMNFSASHSSPERLGTLMDGAALIRQAPGPDSAFSLEPKEFKEMVDAIRVAEKALGRVSYELTKSESASRVFRRSLFVVEDVKKGEKFTKQNVRSIRPGHGLAPKHLPEVLGRRAATDIQKGTPLAWAHVAGRVSGKAVAEP